MNSLAINRILPVCFYANIGKRFPIDENLIAVANGHLGRSLR